MHFVDITLQLLPRMYFSVEKAVCEMRKSEVGQGWREECLQSTPRYRHSRHTASDAEYREYSAVEVEALTLPQHHLSSRRYLLHPQVVRPLQSTGADYTQHEQHE